MKQRNLLLLLATLLWLPTFLWAQRLQQPLGRSVVAVNRSGSTIRNVTSTAGQGNLISWRKLAQEPEGTTYNVYQRAKGATDYTKMNATPLSVTCYAPSTLTHNTEYAVTAISPDGTEGPMSKPFLYTAQAYPNVWFNFDFDNKVIKRDEYRTKFVWPMDLDGNGEFDAVVVDRLYTGTTASEKEDDAENASDNTATTSHKIQGYRLDGTLLWTVDMGPNLNICGGQNDMVLAYDINCDGRCEVIIKSSDGTRFWDKQAEAWGKYAMGSDKADVDGDGVVDYRSHATRVPPFYVSVIDGLTGAELACSELKYSEVHDGSDTYTRNSRANYMSFGYAVMNGHFAIAYLDGIHPSLIMECLDRDNNKSHHNYVYTWDYDWTGGTPTNWHHSSTWSRNDKRPWPAEFHQLRVADVNGDGYDEMVQGGYSVNPLKGWFSSPGIGHGDRFIVSDIDPDRPGLEAYAIQQSDLLGQLIYDPATGEHIKEWYLPSVYDVGRGACLDIDGSHKGYEILSYADEFVYDCKGEKTGQTRTGSTFEGVWWDGRLQREWLNSPGGKGVGTNLMVTRVLGDRLCEFSQESNWATHANTGTRPAFMGDLTGDWREEVILAKQGTENSTGLVGYTTNIPTTYSIYCLQQDPHYRLDCTTRGYYQHPNTGFYLGGGMPMPPLPPVFEADLRWKGNGQWTSFDLKQTADYADGKSLMFDLSGDNSSVIKVDQPFNAPVIYLMNPKNHDYDLQSSHLWTTNAVVTTGTGMLIKSMQGTAAISGYLRHSGKTIISEGTLQVNGEIAGPVELRAKGTLSGDVTLQDTITFEGALNYEGCRLMPGNDNIEGSITSKRSMTIPGNVYLEVAASLLGNSQGWTPVCGHLVVEGDLTFKGTNYITVKLASQEEADYVLAQCSGTLTCDATKLKTRGLDGVNYDLLVEDNKLILRVNATRAPAIDVTWTGAESGLWDYKTKNFVLADEPTAFVTGDKVVFTADGAHRTITLNDPMPTGGVAFNGGVYTLSGNGGISGQGDVVVNSGAKVTFNLKNSDYTGKTIVNQGGMLTVPNFYDGGQKSSIGASAATEGNLQLNGGTLVLSKDNMATDHVITLSDTATIRIAQANSALSLKGQVKGTGYLVKDGPGQLNFTYGGANSFAGMIVKSGIIAQGAWNSTFGRSGSPMVLEGGEVHQIDVNSTSAVPDLNHTFTVVKGTTNRILGSSRGKIRGKVTGEGNLTVETRYVRCDVSLDFTDFEGKLTLAGSQCRLMSNVTDMRKTTLQLAAGAYVAHFASGSASETAATLKIGSLASASTVTDAVLGGSSSTYEIGYLNENTNYYGLLKAGKIVKVGDGRLSLRTAGHTSPITINSGVLEVNNSGTAALTTGTITVAKGGTLVGNALVGSVIVQNGGTVKGGLNNNSTGTLRIGSTLTLNKGAVVLCQLSASNNTKLEVSGKIRHNGDTILVSIPASRSLAVGDEITVFTSGTQTGELVVKVESEGENTYEMDSSTLLTDGKLRVASVLSAIAPVLTDESPVDVYSADGIKLRSAVRYGEALRGLPQGIYMVGGRKIVVRN